MLSLISHHDTYLNRSSSNWTVYIRFPRSHISLWSINISIIKWNTIACYNSNSIGKESYLDIFSIKSGLNQNILKCSDRRNEYLSLGQPWEFILCLLFYLKIISRKLRMGSKKWQKALPNYNSLNVIKQLQINFYWMEILTELLFVILFFICYSAMEQSSTYGTKMNQPQLFCVRSSLDELLTVKVKSILKIETWIWSVYRRTC